MNINYYKPFCDWLSISYPTSVCPESELLSFISSVTLLEQTSSNNSKETYKSETGSVHLNRYNTPTSSSVGISMSGTIIRSIREAGLFNEFVMILGSAPYNITRLDAAIDIPLAGNHIIAGIQRLYPNNIALIRGRPRTLNFIVNSINSPETTGTVYFQDSKYGGHINLKVYDKQHQAAQKLDMSISPTTRYELSVNRGASLSDIVNPAHVLFHYLPSELLSAPNGITILPWKPTERISYDTNLKGSITDYQEFKNVLEHHPGLSTLIDHSLSFNGGSELLLRHIKQRIEKNGEAMQRSGDSCGLISSSLLASTSELES